MKYKIPFRSIYTETVFQWMLEIVWCFIVLKLFPGAHNFGNNSTPGTYEKCPYCNSTENINNKSGEVIYAK